MANTAPGAERLAGADEDAPTVVAHTSRRRWRWAWAAVFALVVVVLFDAYLHLSKTYPENSDEANILLMANDMLHGNLYLHGWYTSDVPFITTELPEIALLVGIFGLHLNTAHIAAALTYTLVVAVGMLLAKGKARGWAAVARMALALAVMLAPQPGVGVFVVVFSVGHIGTALPVMLAWLALDWLGRRWYTPVIVAVLLAWALMADPLVLVIAIFPLLAVCAVRFAVGLATSPPGDLRVLAKALAGRWFELSLAAAAGVAYLIVKVGRQLLSNAGGYTQQPVPFKLDATGKWFMQARVAVHGLLEMFGAYFVPGQHPPGMTGPTLGGLDQAVALTRLVVVVAAVWGACAIARRFFFRDADFVSQLLLVGIVANLAAYITSTLADNPAANTREIAPVLPFAAVLAARMLGDRLVDGRLAGPLRTVRLRGKQFGVRVVAVSLVALLGWYGFGLWRQADTPAAPTPYASLVSFLEKNHLKYGLGGYWQASVITVESGGAVTIRAVTSACLQPYQWEAKASWYDASTNFANFVLITTVRGGEYPVRVFEPAAWVLFTLNVWDGKLGGHPGYPKGFSTGGTHLVGGVQIWPYTAREYPVNVLAQLPRLVTQITKPPPWLRRNLVSQGKTPAQIQALAKGCAANSLPRLRPCVEAAGEEAEQSTGRRVLIAR
jgi:hypothetical protein